MEQKWAIVIISKDRRTELLNTLAHLSVLHDQARVIVVDNASCDDTGTHVQQEYPQVKYIRLSENLGSHARNIGVEAAEAEYIAFADDDSWWAEDALGKATQLFANYPSLALIQARILLGDKFQEDPLCRLIKAHPLPQKAELPGLPILGFAACGALFRKSAFLSVGGFWPQFAVGGEEQILAIDLAERGWDLIYCDDITAYHWPSPIRDRKRRSIQLQKNSLMTVALRRPSTYLWSYLGKFAVKAFTDVDKRSALKQLLPQLAWIIKNRRPVSRELEERISYLEKASPF